MIETEVIDALLADATVAGLCGDRVSAEWRAQGAPVSSITVSRISSLSVPTFDGRSLTEVRVQVSIFATSYTALKTLSVAVRDLFDGFYGMLGAVRVAEARRESESDLSAIDGDRDSRAGQVDFVFWVQE